MKCRSNTVLASLAVLLLAAMSAPAAVNPNFTPKDLLRESNAIMLVRLTLDDKGEIAQTAITKMLKGDKPQKPPFIDLTITAFEEHAKDLAARIKQVGEGEALLCTGRDEAGRDAGFLHILSKWFRLEPGPDAPGWDMDKMDAKMEGTWNGSTDMLVRCLQYIQAVGPEDAHVPVVGGTTWRDSEVLGKARGKVTAVAAVDLAGDGLVQLYIASPDGDQLFGWDGAAKKVVEITDARKLTAKSRVSAWGDFNADGRVDLASFDGATLTVHSQQADGTFAAAATDVKLPADCGGLAVLGLGRKGTCALVAAGFPPTVLAADGKGGFAAVAMPEFKAPAEALGAVQRPLVADFTDDGLPDILQPGETNGLLYAAKADGTFAPAVTCHVWCTRGGGKASIGDFDEDGWPDVLATGAEGVRIFQNNRDGTFEELMVFSGEVSYKTYPHCSGGGVCDFNNDGLPDLFITYTAEKPLLYFNRGFRSFAQAPIVERELNGKLPGLDTGQQGGVFADLNGDAAQDFVIVRADGQICWVPNDLAGGVMALRPRLAAAAGCPGPVGVKVYKADRLLGVWQAAVGAAPAMIGVLRAAEFTVKPHFPGRPVQPVDVEVEEGAAGVALKP